MHKSANSQIISKYESLYRKRKRTGNGYNIGITYQEDDDAVNKYTNHSGDYGTPTRKPAAAFYNGEVAYDLNSFYLNKRYYNNQTLSEENRVSYKFLQRDDNGNLKETTDIGYYPKDKATYAEYVDLGYVESRYKDGDFPVAERLAACVLSLPMHTELDEEQLEYITSNVLELVKMVTSSR